MSIHPIFSVLITRPELVMDHVAGYAGLVQEEASTVGTAVVKRAVAWAVAAVALLVFLILAGVAIMLGAIGGFHWALIVVPAVVLAIALGALVLAVQKLPTRAAFTELRAQFDADAQALRTMGART